MYDGRQTHYTITPIPYYTRAKNETVTMFRVERADRKPLFWWYGDSEKGLTQADFETFTEACRCVTKMADAEQDHADNWDAVSEARMQC